MGEKPLSIDEALVPTATVGGVAPAGGFDTPPPDLSGAAQGMRLGMETLGAGADRPPPIDGGGGAGIDDGPPDMSGASLVITTRSNIKSSGAMARGGEAGIGADRPPPIDGGGGAGIDDGPPDLSGAAIVNTTRSNIKNAGSVAAPAGEGAGAHPEGLAIKEQGIKYGEAASPQDGGSGAARGAVTPGPTRPGSPGPTDPGDPFPGEEGAELRESGKRGWYRPSAAGGEPDAAGVAADGEPIPGADVKLGRNPGSGAATVGPVKPEPTRPGDPTPTDGGPAGIAVKEQGVKHTDDAGDVAPAGDDAPGVAGANNPIPGVDVIVRKDR